MNSEYFFARVRTTKHYFAFLLVQLLLSLFVVIVALIEPQRLKSSFTLAAEIVVALCIALDILVRANSEPQFWRSRGNQLDVGILALLVAILLFVCLFAQDRPGESALEADDIILLVVIILRYSVQIGRLVCQIRTSHQSIFAPKHLLQIDIAVPRSQVREIGPTQQPELQTSAFVKNAIMRLAEQRDEFIGSQQL